MNPVIFSTFSPQYCPPNWRYAYSAYIVNAGQGKGSLRMKEQLTR